LILLSADTSTKICSVALYKDSDFLSEFSSATTSHSTVLLPMIEEMLKANNIKFNEIDVYAVSTGPGSFTGIRIGVSTIKGLAYPYNTACIGVSSLDSLAKNISGIQGIVVPVIDARNDLVYTSVYNASDNKTEKLTEDSQMSVSDLLQMLEKNYGDAKIHFTGDAARTLYERSVDYSIKTVILPDRYMNASAYGTGKAALDLIKDKNDLSSFTYQSLNPVYLKKTQAEREREEKITKNG